MTDTHMEMPWEDKGRDWVMHWQVAEHQRLPANHQKLGERARDQILPHSPQKESAQPTL